MEIDEKDDFKLKGQIRFKVEKFSEFALAPVGTRRQSNVIFVRGLPWQIQVVNLEYKQIKYLGYFLYCNADNSGYMVFMVFAIATWNFGFIKKILILDKS